MKTNALLTDLTPQQEEKVTGGNYILSGIIGYLISQGLDPKSAYHQALKSYAGQCRTWALWVRR